MKNGPCPSCDLFAIRRVDEDEYVCDNCEDGFVESDLDIDYTRAPVDVDPERIHEGQTNAEYTPSPSTEPDDEPELTPMEKSKQNLSNACFVLGIMACITIIGIPLGIVFFVLAALVAPDKQAES
ncbi:hypothetical protein AArcMg_1510 [Natrarchaeobaculum sulfurireducens]|uniref:Uncharacterized protein n=1 Tax=Natrarchaeobaculum sulfurireducens TaxID=2044521 RepID=A0A346PPS8_9EURY|nr:hypothetical protein AArcMg_1510 [Natrarchaeobaculum sulfurireducens]